MSEFFLKQLYQSLLGREPDVDGQLFWQQLLDSGQVTEAEVVQQFLDSTEFTDLSEPIARLYYAILDRAPDTEGLSFWMQAYRNGATLEEITESFLSLPEYLEGQGERSDLEFIEAIYRDVLDRESDAVGAQFWVMQLAQGASRANVILGFAQSSEFVARKGSTIEYVLLHQALVGETPAQDVIAQALEIGVRIQIIENVLERVTRGQGGGSTPEPDVPPTPEPEPEPPSDTTAPTITAFFVTSASSLSVTSTESGRAGLFNGGNLIGSEVSLLAPDTPYSLPVAAQPEAIVVGLKVFDTANNVTSDPTPVFLGTDGSDTLTGTAGADFIFGFGGGNVLDGGAGADVIMGGDGNDTITGGEGSDSLNGGGGDDRFIYANSSDLSAGFELVDFIDGGSGTNTLVIGNNVGTQNAFEIDSTMSWSRMSNVSRIEAVGPFLAQFNIVLHDDAFESGLRVVDLSPDTDTNIIGNANYIDVSAESSHENGYVLIGSSYIDFITGGAGNDTITGGAGADVINAGAGVNVINAGNGLDVVTVNTASTNTVNLELGGAANLTTVTVGATALDRTTTIQGVGTTLDQRATALGTVGVIMTNAGLSGTVLFTGGDGADSLVGGTGADTLNGGGGNDTLTGGSGNDTFLIDSGSDQITDLSDSDVFIISAGAYLSTATISGNFLATAASQNLGGTRDNAQFAMASGVAVANFAAMTVASVENGGIRIDAHASTASTITGSSGSDSITGSSAADSLDGGDGNDTITGGAGADVINAGAGANVITDAGVGADMITHNSAGTVAIAVTGTDTVTLTASETGATATGFDGAARTIDASTSTADVELIGGDGADVLTGGAGSDTITGGAGNNTITGGAGSDHLYGGDGDDVFRFTDNVQLREDAIVSGGAGIDTIVFETAIDTLKNGSPQGDNFHADFLRVTSVERVALFGSSHVNLGGVFPGAGITTILTGDGDTTLRYDTSELGLITVDATVLADAATLRLIGGGAFSGQRFNVINLRGDVNANELGGSIAVTAAAGAGFAISVRGGDGADTITGGAGNDTITGGVGADRINAGAGANVITDAGVGADIITHDSLGTVAIAVTGSDTVTLTASRAGATATGANGDSRTINASTSTVGVSLIGGDGDDILYGGFGNDTLTGGAGNDTFTGEYGANVITDAGIGQDTVVHDKAGTVAIAVTGTDEVRLIAIETGATATSNAAVNTTVNATTSTAAVTLNGDTGNDSLTGGSGNDVISGGDGNDTITGGAGADVINAGAGANVIIDAGVGADVITHNSVGTVAIAVTGTDTVTLTASQAGATATGADGATRTINASTSTVGVSLIGGDGDDILYGGFGNDTLTGGAGNDTFTGEYGANVITDAGIGRDTVVHDKAGTVAIAVTGSDEVRLIAIETGATATAIAGGNRTVNARDSSANVVIDGTNLAASEVGSYEGGTGNDTITGGLGNDIIMGGAGDDSLVGGAGNDLLMGSAGNNTMTGGTGNDTFESGTGHDVITDFGDGGADDIVVTNGATATATLVAGNTVTTGTAVLNAAAGALTVLTVVSTQVAAGSTVSFAAMAGVNGITLNTSTQAATNGLALIGSRNNDVITGGAGNDVISGGDGNDTITGGAGADTIDGGVSSNNTASYSTSAAAVTVNLTTNLNTGGDAEGDSLTNIQNLVGSAFGDTLTGDTADNIITGGAGEDTLTGGDGNDTFIYAMATELLESGQLVDAIIDGGNGTDRISVDGGLTVVVGDSWLKARNIQELFVTGTAASSIVLGTTAETAGISTINISESTTDGNVVDVSAYNGAGNITIVGSATNTNNLMGSSGFDIITGGAGNDTITGGAGADRINAGAGTNVINTGDGRDVITVNTASTNTVNLSLGTVNNQTQVIAGAGTGELATTITAGTLHNKVDLRATAFGSAVGVIMTAASATGTTSAWFEGGNGADSLTGSLNADYIDGGRGNDTITGGAGADSLYGMDGDDTFVFASAAELREDVVVAGGSGTNTLWMNTFGDTLILIDSDFTNVNDIRVLDLTGFGPQSVTLGTNTNRVFSAGITVRTDATATSLNLQGGLSSVSISATGTNNADTIVGGAGNDIIAGGGGNDSLTGGLGVDTFNVTSGTDTITDLGLGGQDVLVVSGGATANATMAADYVATVATRNTSSTATLTSDDFDVDLLLVTAGDAGFTINASASSDAVTLKGSAFADTIIGGAGDDNIYSGNGNDTITGGAGIDYFVIDAGANAITDFGVGGNDRVQIEVSATLAAAVTQDYVAQYGGNIYNKADVADVVFYVADGIDFDASLATDTPNGISITASGNAAVSTLVGTNKDDAITGGDGNDTITGGAGADRLTGGLGADTFVYATGATGITLAEADAITDFTTADDFISTGVVGFIGDVTIVDGTLLADFNAFVTAANAAFAIIGDDVYVAWNATGSGNAWVAINNNGGATFNVGDSLIVLEGINTGGGIDATNFIA